MNPFRNLGYYNRIQGCCLGSIVGSDLNLTGMAQRQAIFFGVTRVGQQGP
jgi:hypothetical protein